MSKKTLNIQGVIAVAFITLLLMVTSSSFPLPIKGELSNWSLCHWGITYETGFIYRGLIGTITTTFLGIMTIKKIYYISLLLLFVIYILSTFSLIKVYKKNSNIYSFILILFIVCQPSNVRWWLVDEMFVRLDMFIAIIAMLCCMLIINCKKQSILYSGLLIASIVALLIHEVFGVLFVSTIFAITMYKANKDSDKINLKPLFIYYIPILVVFLIIVFTGSRDMEVDKLSSVFEKNLSADFSYSMPVVIKRAIKDSFSQKMSEVGYLFTPKVKASMILTYVVMAPALLLFFCMYYKMFKAQANKNGKISIVLVFGSCFAPLSSSFIAYDQFRWIGFFIVCLSIGILSLYFLDRKMQEVILDFVNKYKYWFVCAIFITLVLGVLHDMYGFNRVEYFLSYFY